MRQKRIMILFWTTEIFIVLGGCGNTLGGFFFSVACGRNLEGNPKGDGRRIPTIINVLVHPDQYVGEFHYRRLHFYSLCTST